MSGKYVLPWKSHRTYVGKGVAPLNFHEGSVCGAGSVLRDAKTYSESVFRDIEGQDQHPEDGFTLFTPG